MENLLTVKSENLNLGLMKKMTAERMAELFHTGEDEKQEGHLLVCVGSWAAYNAGGRHSLGTCYKGDFFIDFMALNGSEELDGVLDYLGWSEQEKEELFIQDYESDFYETENADYTNPRSLADFINDNRKVFSDSEAMEKIAAYVDYYGGESSFKWAVENVEKFEFFPGITAADYAEELTESTVNIPEFLKCYIDYQKMGKDCELDGKITETKKGVFVW